MTFTEFAERPEQETKTEQFSKIEIVLRFRAERVWHKWNSRQIIGFTCFWYCQLRELPADDHNQSAQVILRSINPINAMEWTRRDDTNRSLKLRYGKRIFPWTSNCVNWTPGARNRAKKSYTLECRLSWRRKHKMEKETYKNPLDSPRLIHTQGYFFQPTIRMLFLLFLPSRMPWKKLELWES